MLLPIAAFELRYQLLSLLFFICFAIFLVLAFVLVASPHHIGAPGAVNVNSPYAILQTFGALSSFGLFAITAFVASAAIRDHQTGFAPTLFATPLRKSDYLPNLGYEHGLYRFGYTPPVPLSDMNGMGRFWIARAWFEVYWSACAAMLAVLAVLLLRRGTQTRLVPRLAAAWVDLHGLPGGILAWLAAVWLGSGRVIYYNTNVLNDYPHQTALGEERYLAGYEKALLRYESVPQPKIVAVQLGVQLYPRQARADTVGSYVLENRTSEPISVLHVRWRTLAKAAQDAGA